MSKAFFNLLKREDTRLSLVKAQLAQAMVRLTKEDDKELSKMSDKKIVLKDGKII